LNFVNQAQLDWCGFFAFSPEEGTHAISLPDRVPVGLMNERLAELRELQDSITAQRRDDLIGTKMTVLIDETGVARSHREAPEIDGVVHVSETLAVASFVEVEIADALGPDLVAVGASAVANDEANELVDDAR
jgi:ribosomal protein S12 methylthiotransferase